MKRWASRGQPPNRDACRAVVHRACRPCVLAPIIVAALLVGKESLATGFFINQQSVAGLGRADAGNVAASDDASTLFFNPAALAASWEEGDSGHRFSVGLHVIVPRSDLTDAGSGAITPGTLGAEVPVIGDAAEDPSDPTPVLNLYYARPLIADRLLLGLRFNSPFGLAAEYEPSWFGRYDATTADLLTANMGVALAYRRSDRLSVGGGIDVQYADAELGSAIPNPLAPGGPSVATDAHFTAEGDDVSVGFNVGMSWDFADGARVGLHYRSSVRHDLSGSATTGGLTGLLSGFNETTSASTEFSLPEIAAAGVAYRPPGSAFTLYGDYTWYGWSRFDSIVVRLSGNTPDVERSPSFRDTWSIAAGADYVVGPRLTIRGGIKHDRTPTVDASRDTTFADDDRLWLSVGGTYSMSPRLALDFAVVHVLVDDTEVDSTRTFFGGTPLASLVRTRASVDSTVNTLAVSWRWRL